MDVGKEPDAASDAPLVVVGAVIVRDGKTLAAQRSRPASLAGGWEFPGGKAEPGESEAAALVRECDEELGVAVEVLERVGPDVELPGGGVLRCYFARLREGLANPAAGSSHDSLRWLAPDELADLGWLPADQPVVAAVRERLLEGERFAGGQVGGAVRIGDTVRRPTGPWTPAVHALIAHLRAAGLPYVPEVRGFDELGREVLAYVPGETFGNDEWPDWARSDALLEQAMRWLAAYHDAVRSFRPAGAVWRLSQQRELASDELICHNDVAPYNIVVTDPDGDLRIAGIVDWDVAGPGLPIDDLAFGAWNFLPLWDPELPIAEAARKLRLLVSAYGAYSPVEVLRRVPVRMAAGMERIRQGAAAGDQGMQNLLSKDNLHFHERALALLAERTPEIEDALRRKGIAHIA